jgi:hypothetical protein
MYLFSVGQMAKGPPRRGLRTQPRVKPRVETRFQPWEPTNKTLRPEAHKALRRCALDEKHPVLRVGDAEGARGASNGHITTTPCVRVLSTFDPPPLQGASLGVGSQG